MKIVILDAYTLFSNDLSKSSLEALGECQFYDRTLQSEVIERCQDAQIILTNKVMLDETILRALPKCRYIGVLATGYNVVDLKAASQLNIVVTNVPAYSTQSVAQHVFSLLLACTNHVASLSHSVEQGKWTNAEDFCFWQTPLIELADKTMGLIGYGHIAKNVAQIAKAFGMNVLVYTPRAKQHPDVEFTSLKNVLKQADVLSLHCPLNSDTDKLINHEHLALMKSSAILINTGRGGLIDEDALAQALKSRRLYAAALDVLTLEPPHKTPILSQLDNCFITPHVAWASLAARKRMLAIVTENLLGFQTGHLKNRVL